MTSSRRGLDLTRPLAAAVGLAADRLLGEPPTRPHPVAAFGSVMERVERTLWVDSRVRGALHAGAGVAVALAAGTALQSTAVATYVAAAGRALGEAALDVGQALEAGNLDRARTLLPSLVGRDPAGLDAGAMARAVVESVAENTVDAVVATGLWAAIAGARGATVHRAANTMDAMVGNRSERYARYGTASARLDDVLAWVPARATALLVAAVRPRSALAIWTAVRRDAPAHPSPNSGVAEAAFAAALGLRLGGPSRYGDRVEERPRLGDGRVPEAADVRRAVRLAADVQCALAGVLAAVGLTRSLRGRQARIEPS